VPTNAELSVICYKLFLLFKESYQSDLKKKWKQDYLNYLKKKESKSGV
jgi:hypothetical protein